jgi:hypothetical protein
MTRRRFLAFSLALLPWTLARAAGARRSAAYDVDVGILYGILTFHLAGRITEAVDRAQGRYEVRADGEGAGIVNRMESRGIWRDGRWTPTRTSSLVVVYGRESRLEVAYDHAAGVIDYRSRAETFLLRRLRVAEDVVPIPGGMHVDDVASATLNYAEGAWPPRADGAFETHVVRRRRPANEGADDVERAYRAELVPFVLRIVPDPESTQPTALIDFSRFSSWAREGRPARVTFGDDRRPRTIASSLILGTSVTIRVHAT